MTGVGPSGRFDRRSSLLLAIPAIIVLAVFFILPLAALLQLSLTSPSLGLGNYVRALTTDVYLRVLWRTVWLALVVTVLALVLAYPVALTMARASKRVSFLIGLGVLVPLWTSVVVRSYAWIILLQRDGLVNKVLLAVGLIRRPLAMLYSEGTVIVAMTHVLLPFMVLSIFGALRTIPKDLPLAAANLGAGRLTTFRLVILPLSLPGIYSGVLMVFIISLGFYVTPALLGGPETLLASTLIGQQTTETLDWGLAGALSVILLALTLVLVALFGRMLRLETKGA